MTFHATDAGGHPVYHTNVMMAIGTDVAVVCLESVADAKERQHLLSRLSEHHKAAARLCLHTFPGCPQTASPACRTSCLSGPVQTVHGLLVCLRGCHQKSRWAALAASGRLQTQHCQGALLQQLLAHGCHDAAQQTLGSNSSQLHRAECRMSTTDPCSMNYED